MEKTAIRTSNIFRLKNMEEIEQIPLQFRQTAPSEMGLCLSEPLDTCYLKGLGSYFHKAFVVEQIFRTHHNFACFAQYMTSPNIEFH